MENLSYESEGSTSGTQAAPSSSAVQEQVNEGSSVTIKMEDLDPNWMTSIKERLRIEGGRLKESSSTTFSCSIYRVPHCLRQYNEKAYDPQLVSIGPFHYEKRQNQLHEMEKQKWRFLDAILSRREEVNLETYFAAVKELEDRARKCYSEVITLDSKSFVEMMVLDGCFIIEIVHRDKSGGFKDVAIFQSKWMRNVIMTDLLLLENQIPFFILQRLSDLMGFSVSDFFSMIISFFCDDVESDSAKVEKLSHSNCQHMLHLTHKASTLYIDEKCLESCDFQRIPCASKLAEKGIKFRMSNEGIHVIDILAIKFQKGVLEIPNVKFCDVANVSFLNLIAFEQCYCPCKQYITAYVAFMNCLISTGKDVEILCREGIISYWLGSDGDVASLFNNMVRELTVRAGDFYLSGVCKKINQYCEGAWPKMRATLVHDYFRNRWASISIFAGLLLLIFTFTQTFLSAFPKFANGK